jgi:hypothetical protein
MPWAIQRHRPSVPMSDLTQTSRDIPEVPTAQIAQPHPTSIGPDSKIPLQRRKPLVEDVRSLTRGLEL